MKKIATMSGRAVPVCGNDIDTDRIIPARFLRCVTFDGLGTHVFADDRQQLTAAGKTHAFDDARFRGANILIVNSNFGCGSSREHAPQALNKWGVTAIIGVSFSEIFYGNCVAMGVPIVQVSMADSEALQQAVDARPEIIVHVDIDKLEIQAGTVRCKATMNAGIRQQFLAGTWDATGELLSGLDQVRQTAARLPYVRNFA